MTRVAGVPVLLRDPGAMRAALDDARAGVSGAWYDADQHRAWTGPYRHTFAKRRAYLDRVLAGERTHERAVDLGCGDGVHADWLAGHASRVWASDYNDTRILRAASRARKATVFVADITDYPAVDDAFDLVFCNHVLEHIPDDERALREIRRITAPGGLVVIGTPNEGEAFWRLAYRLSPESRRTTDHVNFYTAATLTERCRSAGFTVEHVEHIGWGVPHWKLDAALRNVRLVDDLLERTGRRLFRSQATSLYVLLRG